MPTDGLKNNIRRLRFDNNEMTQQALADKASVTRQTIIAIDERDQTIRRRASEWAFNVLAIFVFLSCIALHDAFRQEQGVPIGWLWFLAYSSFILAYLSQSLAATILYCSSNQSQKGEQDHE
jgi:putative transcriptional regulator